MARNHEEFRVKTRAPATHYKVRVLQSVRYGRRPPTQNISIVKHELHTCANRWLLTPHVL